MAAKQPLDGDLYNVTADPIFNEWCITPEHGVTLDDVLSPSYWAHVGRKLRPDDHIWVKPVDRSFVALLLVLDATPNAASLAVLHKFGIDNVGEADIPDAGHMVRWGGPKARYQVVRKSDKAVIESMLQTKPIAVARLASIEAETSRLAA